MTLCARSRRRRSLTAPNRAAAVLAIVLALAAGHLAAQGRSATMSVLARVVRPCSVSAPSSAPRVTAGLEVAVACGGDPARVLLTPGAGMLPVAGAKAGAVVSTSRDGTGTLRVAVDF